MRKLFSRWKSRDGVASNDFADFFGSVSSVHTALLQRNMDFKKLFWVRFVTVCLPGIASIPLAWYGWGHWALVAGTLAGQLAQMIMLWRMSYWRPSMAVNIGVTSEMAKFGGWVGATGLLTWFYAWADSLVVGHYLGSHDLGLFRTGCQFPAIIFALFFGPIVPVLYSQISRIGHAKDRMKEIAEFAIGMLTIVSIPVAAFLFIYSEHIEALIFGDKWNGVGVVLGVMALMHGFSWIVGMNGEFYRATGNPSCETIVTAGAMGVYLLVYLMIIHQGLRVFVWARMALAIGALVLHLIVLNKIFNVNLLLVVRRIVFISMISAFAIFYVKEFSICIFVDRWAQFIIGCLMSATAVLFSIYILERKKICLQITTMVRKNETK